MSSGLHVGQSNLSDDERALEVDLQHPVPLRVSQFLERDEAGDARIIDKNGDGSESAAKLRNRRFDLLAVGDVGVQRDGPAAGGHNLVGDLGCVIDQDVEHTDRDAIARGD
jgi:hypothetical protein